MDVGGAGPVVVSAGPELGCGLFIIQSARFERSATSRDPQTIYTTSSAVFKLICSWATPPLRPLDIKHVMNGTRPSPFCAALPHPCIIVNENRRTEKTG